MTTPSGYTASWLLSGARGEVSQGLTAIVRDMAQRGVLGKLSDQAFGLINSQLTDATYGLLTIDLGALLVTGWKRHAALMAAGRRTAADPTTSEVVQLAEHDVEVTHRPTIDLLINDVKLAEIALELSLELHVDVLNGTVRGGRLAELTIGTCTATGRLGCADVRLAEVRHRMEPAFTAGLGRGINLVDDSAATGQRA
jgi:hypothetical protein